MKKFYASIAALTLMVSGILLLNVMGGVSHAMPTDCDGNSIIYCGATSASTLASKYKANKTGDLDNIYHAYGLTDDDMIHASTRAKMGAVHKDGRVTVGNEVVATNAKTIGRDNMSGSHKKVIGGKTYYERAPSVSFGSESIVAYVFFDANGEFKAAVITSCGNPVVAAPKPKPVYTCNSLTANKITRTEYSFDASATAKNGASVTSYSFDFGDGSKATSTSKTAKHTYAKEGTYTIKVSVNVKVGSSTKTVTSTKCQTKITVTPPPVTPSYTCDSLEKTAISRTEYSFTGKATVAGGATITGYSFDFDDGSTQTVTNPSGVTHSYTTEGTYTIKMSVTVKVNDETKTVTSANCTTQVTIAAAPSYSCDALELTKISNTDYSFDGKATAAGGATIVGYTFDFGDGKQQTATNPSGVTHTYAKDGAYTATLSVTVSVNGENKTVTSAKCVAQITVLPPEECKPGIPKGDVRCTPEECKPGIPMGDVRCTECKPGIPTGDVRCTECKPGIPAGDARCTECKPGIPAGDERCTPPTECKPGVPTGSEECTPCDVPGKENLPKNSTDCVETPVELPHTGTTGLIGGTIGIGSIVTAAGYYIASRRGLLDELLKR